MPERVEEPPFTLLDRRPQVLLAKIVESHIRKCNPVQDVIVRIAGEPACRVGCGIHRSLSCRECRLARDRQERTVAPCTRLAVCCAVERLSNNDK